MRFLSAALIELGEVALIRDAGVNLLLPPVMKTEHI